MRTTQTNFLQIDQPREKKPVALAAFLFQAKAVPSADRANR
jgi:hypothetical protein